MSDVYIRHVEWCVVTMVSLWFWLHVSFALGYADLSLRSDARSIRCVR